MDAMPLVDTSDNEDESIDGDGFFDAKAYYCSSESSSSGLNYFSGDEDNSDDDSSTTRGGRGRSTVQRQ